MINVFYPLFFGGKLNILILRHKDFHKVGIVFLHEL